MSEQLTLDYGEKLAVRLLRSRRFYVGRAFRPVSRPTGWVGGIEVEEAGFIAQREADGRTFMAGSLLALAQKAIPAPVEFSIRTEADYSGGIELAA